MKDWLHATQEMIDGMTYEDMIEILEEHIGNDNGGDFAPRKHTVKMFKTCVELLKKAIKERDAEHGY